MENSFDLPLGAFTTNGLISNEEMKIVEKRFGFALPEQYKSFMLTRNGGEGFIGSQYLVLWRAGELIKFNREFEAEKYAPRTFALRIKRSRRGICIRHQKLGNENSNGAIHWNEPYKC